jgi:hypothetical protein
MIINQFSQQCVTVTLDNIQAKCLQHLVQITLDGHMCAASTADVIALAMKECGLEINQIAIALHLGQIAAVLSRMQLQNEKPQTTPYEQLHEQVCKESDPPEEEKTPEKKQQVM